MGNGHFVSAHSAGAGLEATLTSAAGGRVTIASEMAPTPASAIAPAKPAICRLFIAQSSPECRSLPPPLVPRYECARCGDLGAHGIGILGERNGRRIVLAGLGLIARPFGGLRGAEGGTEPVRLLLQRCL